jgi:hypothetical protein
MQKSKMISAAMLSLRILISCGGGGEDSASAPAPPATSAQGFWSGTSAAGSYLSGVVLDDGTYYIMYVLPGQSTISGYVQGISVSSNGSFTSSNARDFNFTGGGVTTGSITGTYTEKQLLAGVVNYTDGTNSAFSLVYDPDYETTPVLAELAGTYTGQIGIVGSVLEIENAVTTIVATGNFTGVGSSGCTGSGRLTPRAHGNVFDATLTFGALCSRAGQTITGIAGLSADSKNIQILAPNAARTEGFIFVGTRP